MKKRFRNSICTPVLFLLFICGCVNLERAYPDKHYYVLELGPVAPKPAPAGNGVLEVSELRVSPRYADPSFVYRLSDAGYESDFYNQFLVPPATLITEEVRKGLGQSGVLGYVVSPATQLPATYKLQGTVTALYGDFRNATAPNAVLEVEFFLTKPGGNPNEIVLAKRYAKSAPLNGRSPEALVKGWDQALAAVLNDLIADVKSANLQPANITQPAVPGTNTSGAAENR